MAMCLSVGLVDCDEFVMPTEVNVRSLKYLFS
jgi:hypothetical protein